MNSSLEYNVAAQCARITLRGVRAWSIMGASNASGFTVSPCNSFSPDYYRRDSRISL